GEAPSQGSIDNAADRARATAALGAAAEAAIDLARGARCLAAIERRADVLIAQHVARTDDHGDQGSWAVVSSLCNYRYMRPRRQAKTKRRFFSYSNVRLARARDRRASSRFSQAAATGETPPPEGRRVRGGWAGQRRCRRPPPPPPPCRRPRPRPRPPAPQPESSTARD